MADYSLVVNSRFQPFSFERYLQPYQIYGQEYKAQEAALEEIANNSGKWENLINEQTDPDLYNQVVNYNKELDSLASGLVSSGLSPTSRQSLLKMKSRYNKEFAPIEQAYVKRAQLAEEQRQLSIKDPTMMYDRDISLYSLQDFIDNPNLSYNSYSGALLTKQVAENASKLAKELRENDRKWNYILGGQYYESLMRKGYSSKEIEQALKKDGKYNTVLRQLVEDAVNSSGVKDWGDINTINQAYDWAGQGLWAAVGEDKYETLSNKNFNSDPNPPKPTNTRSGTSKTKNANIDRTTYAFVKDRELASDILDKEGKLIGDLDRIFKDGIFTKPEPTEEERSRATSRPGLLIHYGNKYDNALAAYNDINDILLRNGFSEDTINKMSKEDIENALQKIQENNKNDLVAEDLYRFSLDNTATEHVLGTIKNRGLKLKEFNGIVGGVPQYSESEESEALNTKLPTDILPADILYDPTIDTFMLLYDGKYYRMPEGMISNDTYAKLRSYVTKNPETGKSYLDDLNDMIEYLESLPKEEITDEIAAQYTELVNTHNKVDDFMGTVGHQFAKFVGKKNINE